MNKKYFSKTILLVAIILSVSLVYTVRLYLGIKNWQYMAIWGAALLVIYTGLICLWIMSGKGLKAFNHLLESVPTEMLIGGTTGLLLGILMSFLSSYPLSMIGTLGAYLMIGIFILFAYTGLKIGIGRAGDVINFFTFNGSMGRTSESLIVDNYKVLDTSAIIDGRIYDVCQSKFLEGQLLVPVFVIEELQHIADSSDYLRRNKGRRGLELLAKMQKHTGIKIDIIEGNIPEEKEVDMKLIRLCKQMNASIITNDYNLNKVAELHGIKVLNINELTNAVKVVVYPGETMHINVLKEGKEPGQGVGYLEDGTMVVVEDAQDELGNQLEVMVTSVFQTAAGRMIFTRRVKEEAPLEINHPLPGVKVQEVKMYG